MESVNQRSETEDATERRTTLRCLKLRSTQTIENENTTKLCSPFWCISNQGSLLFTNDYKATKGETL